MSSSATVSGQSATSLAELRPLLVGSERLTSALRHICAADVIQPTDRWEGRMGDRRPDFLLVEATEKVKAGWTTELDYLLDHCTQGRIPRLLWIGHSPPSPFWLERCARFDRVFTVDEGQLEQLRATGAKMPSPLWPAASPPASGPEAEGVDRPNPVIWIGGWQRQWPTEWTDRLGSVLRGIAGLGLRIFGAESLVDLPPDLRPHVAGAVARDDALALLRSAKVVVCADPTGGSATLAPPIVFDAAASGAAVVTPHAFADRYEFGVGLVDETPPIEAYDTTARSNPFWDLVPRVTDAASARRRVSLLLRDDGLRTESVMHLQRIVRNNHTYANRLATLASAAGFRLTPDALDSAPA